jgi:hypothetical protein
MRRLHLPPSPVDQANMELYNAIKNDIMYILHRRYGNKWVEYLVKPAIPSPDRFISAKYNISIDKVNNIKNQIYIEYTQPLQFNNCIK